MKRATTSPKGAIVFGVIAAVFLTSFGYARERTFTTLDATFPNVTVIQTKAFGINATGQVVGLYVTSNGVTRGFLYDRGEYTDIFKSGSVRTNALGINAIGQIVGRYDTTSNAITTSHGYVYTDGDLQPVDDPDAAGFTVVTDINSSGEMVGRYQNASGTFHGFTLVGGVNGIFTTIDHLDATGNPDMGPQGIQGMAINEEGVIAGYYQDKKLVFHAFLLDHGVFTTVDPPNAIKTGGSGGVLHLNPAGDVAGSYTAAADQVLPCGCQGHGFTYRQGIFTTFDISLAVSDGTINTGINSRGEIVGIYVDHLNVIHGFVAPKDTEED